MHDCTLPLLSLLMKGLVGSVAQISKMPDMRTIHLCATLLNQLTYYPAARVKMAEKGMVLHSLFVMIDAENKGTQIMAARTTSNLVLCHQVLLSVSCVSPLDIDYCS